MNIDKKQYPKYAEAHAPKSPIVKNCVKAFLIGGLICVIGEGFNQLFVQVAKLTKEDAGTVTAIILIFVAVALTALGVYDKIAKHAGAGTLVPITGFANAVASSAIDSHAEGLIVGEGSKIFAVAGPVLLYSTLGGTVYGVFYYLSNIIV